MMSQRWIDRPVYQASVKQAIAQLGSQPRNLLVFYGPPDIGKTGLKHRLIELLSDTYACATINGSGIERHQFPPVEQATFDLRRNLGKAGIKLLCFDIAAAYYWAIAHPSIAFNATGFSKLEDASDHLSTWADLVSSLASDLEKTVPYVGTASKLFWLLQRYSEPLLESYQQNHCDLSQIEEISDPYDLLDRLPPLLATQLAAALQQENRQAIMMIDGYEGLVKPENPDWLIEVIRYPNPWVLWLVFAEQPIDGIPLSQQIEMLPLTEAESLDWLQQMGIADATLRHTLARLCEGSPLYLNACRTICEQIAPRSSQITDFAATAQQLFNQYLSRTEEAVQLAFELLTWPRFWNLDLLEALLAEFQPQFSTDVTALLNQLTASPYIESTQPGWWRLNPLVQQMMQQQQSADLQQLQQTWLYHYYQATYQSAMVQQQFQFALQAIEEALYQAKAVGLLAEATDWTIAQLTDWPRYQRERAEILTCLAEQPIDLLQQAQVNSLLGHLWKQLAEGDRALTTLEQAKMQWQTLQRSESLEAAAVEFDLAEVYLRGDRVFDAGKAADRVLQIRQQQPTPDVIELAACFNQQARIAAVQNNNREAMRLNQEALKLYESIPNLSATTLAEHWLTTAELYLQSHADLAEAARFCQRAIEKLTAAAAAKSPPIESPLLITAHGLLGNIYETWGTKKFQAAFDHYQQALDLAETLLDPSHPQTLLYLRLLARLCRKAGNETAAQKFSDRHNANIAAGEGQETIETAAALNRIGMALYKKGEYGRTEPFWLRALRIRRSQLGAEHPDTALSLNNLAALYKSQGRYSEAEPLYLQALDIYRSQLGPDHPDTASSLNNLAVLYKSQGRYSEAEPLYLQALDIYRSQLGAEHPDTANSLNNLAALYESQGRYGEAEPLYLQALEIRRSQLGAEHPDTANSLNNLAGLYKSQGRYSEAEPLYLQDLEIRRSQLGAEHPDTATSLNNLAGLYDSQGRYSEAEPLYLQTLAILMQTLGENHPNTKTAQGNFRYLLQQVIAAGRTAELSDHPITQEMLAQLQKG